MFRWSRQNPKFSLSSLWLPIVAAVAIGLETVAAQAQQPLTDLQPTVDESELLKSVSNEALAKEYAKRREEIVWKHPPRFDRGSDALETAKNFTQCYIELEKYHREKATAIVTFADSGYAPAQGLLDYYLRDNWSPSIERDVCRALRYAFDGAEGNSMVGMAMLADAYRTGEGISRDEKRSYFWIKETLRRFWPVGDLDIVDEVALDIGTDPRKRYCGKSIS